MWKVLTAAISDLSVTHCPRFVVSQAHRPCYLLTFPKPMLWELHGAQFNR